MGTLVVKAYPTTLLGKAADHAYVECGTGAVGWSCWGGKTGGTAKRQAGGSTRRANDIAEPNERAGITCYLINGVCHQAANRILLPAGITVNGVRGYALSNALYGTYGRASGWPCRAPFNQHPTTTGDLPACVAPPTMVSAPPRADLDEADARYLAEVLAIYQEFDRVFVAPVSREERESFHLQLFAHMVDFSLGSRLGDRRQDLMEVRRDTEQRQQEVENRRRQVGRWVRTSSRKSTTSLWTSRQILPKSRQMTVQAAPTAAEGSPDRAGRSGGDRPLIWLARRSRMVGVSLATSTTSASWRSTHRPQGTEGILIRSSGALSSTLRSTTGWVKTSHPTGAACFGRHTSESSAVVDASRSSLF